MATYQKLCHTMRRCQPTASCYGNVPGSPPSYGGFTNQCFLPCAIHSSRELHQFLFCPVMDSWRREGPAAVGLFGADTLLVHVPKLSPSRALSLASMCAFCLFLSLFSRLLAVISLPLVAGLYLYLLLSDSLSVSLLSVPRRILLSVSRLCLASVSLCVSVSLSVLSTISHRYRNVLY